jgi:hypothetical protein
MNRAIFILVFFTTILFFNDTALAFCKCKQAYYKDEIDFITSYTMCLEQCYNLKIKQLKIKLDNSEKKISELESEMDDLKLRIKLLEDVLSSIKTKNNSKP